MKSLPTHFETTINAPSRTEAVERGYAYYDSHPGRARKPARERVEIYRAKETGFADVWRLWVKVRR